MIETRPLFQINAIVADPQISAAAPTGDRRFIPVLGGEFEGDRLHGKLLAGGSDSQLMRSDDVAELDVRVTLESDDGVIIYMKALGLRHGPADVMQRLASGEDVDPSLYYFRESIMFEAPAGPYEWLNRILAIGVGRREPNSVILDAYEVL